MANPLVPTSTVDKNGRLTTVYKRPAAASHSSPVIPSPGQPVPLRSRQDVAAHVFDKMKELNFILNKDQAEAVTASLKKYTTGFLLKMDETLSDDTAGAIMGQLVCAGENERLINEAVRYMPEMEYNSFWSAVRLVRTLHSYASIPPADDYSTADESVQQQCSALMKVTSAAQCMARDKNTTMRKTDAGQNSYERIAILNDDRLIGLVTDEPQLADQIIEIIRQRGTADFGVINSVLHSESVPLSNGLL